MLSENRKFWKIFPVGRNNASICYFVSCWFSTWCKNLTNFSKANRRFQPPKSTISGFEIDDLLSSKSTVCSNQVVDLLMSSWRFTLSQTSSYFFQLVGTAFFDQKTLQNCAKFCSPDFNISPSSEGTECTNCAQIKTHKRIEIRELIVDSPDDMMPSANTGSDIQKSELHKKNPGFFCRFEKSS